MNAAAPAVVIEIAKGKYTVELSPSGLRVMVQWVDWGQAQLIQDLVNGCLIAITGSDIKVQRQSAVISIQLVPDSDQGTRITLPLASPAVLEAVGVNCFGMALYTEDGRSFMVDRSTVHNNGLFLRIGHDFPMRASPGEICTALQADQRWLAKLYCLEF